MSVRRRAGYAAGGALMLFGVAGLLADATRTHPLGWVLWFAGGIAVHDFVVAPLVALAGTALRRLRAGRAVRAASLVSAFVVAAASPVVLGFGRRADDPSVLPLPYGRNLLLILAVLWCAAGAAALVRRLHRAQAARVRPDEAQATRPGR